MISRTFEAKILVLAVFFVGVLTGVVLTNFYEARVRSDDTGAALGSVGRLEGLERNNTDDAGRRQEHRARIQRQVQRWHDYVGVSLEQQAQIEAILEETRQEFRELSIESRGRYETIREGSRDQIRAILTDEQLLRYEQLLERQLERQRRDFRGRNPD